MNLFVFDIETVPDIQAGRLLYNLGDLSDEDVAHALKKIQKDKNGSDFLPLYLHQVIAISVVLRQQDQLKVWSLGTGTSSEKEIIQRFFNGVDKYTPRLVSWNGTGFDLPVLHYRGLIQKVNAQSYWETGQIEQTFRWNNYINRYHERHTDLMDVLAAYQPRASAPLDSIANLLGFPGKMGMGGDKVWDYYLKGEIEAIRNYCETDVLNTYLVYLRFELMRGVLTESEYQQECEMVKHMLENEGKAHLKEFLNNWQKDLGTCTK